jgi:hypothetical protein
MSEDFATLEDRAVAAEARLRISDEWVAFAGPRLRALEAFAGVAQDVRDCLALHVTVPDDRLPVVNDALERFAASLEQVRRTNGGAGERWWDDSRGSAPSSRASPRTDGLSDAALLALGAVLEIVREVAREERAHPLNVTQRNVEAVVGLPRREFLEAARAGAFPCTKVRRVVIARTEDVARWLDGRRAPRRASGTRSSEDAALARVGARRVSPSPR